MSTLVETRDKVWKFCNTPISELLGWKHETVLDTVEAVNTTVAVGVAATVAAGVAIPTAIPVMATALPFILISIRCFKRYHEKPLQERSLSDCALLAIELAYLKSLTKFLEHYNLPGGTNAETISQEVERQIQEVEKLQFSDQEIGKAIIAGFPNSKLAEKLNNLLLTQLQQIGLNSQDAQTLTARVTWSVHPYLNQAIAEAKTELKPLAEVYRDGWRKEQEKYYSIANYLEKLIASKPLEQVFNESFTFRDIYVPLQAQSVDSNGKIDQKTRPVEIESWVKEILATPAKRSQVMFIQGAPGRGKSVFCRMFADWVRQHLHPVWTPILIRLRDIDNFEENFENTLRNAVGYDFANNDDGWLTDSNTRFLFLLDGFDELRMEGRKSGGLEQFLKQVGRFQEKCKENSEMGHQVIITGRSLALQGIERFMPPNLERVELLPMDDNLQQKWLSKWAAQVGEDKKVAFKQFLQDRKCPKKVKQELAREPLLLYLLAAMHRDNKLDISMFAGANVTKAKILIYQQSLEWVLTEQRPQWLNRELTGQETDGLRRILAEAGLCVVQAGGEHAPVKMIEERLKDDDAAMGLFEQARQRHGENALKNALAAFYLQPAAGNQGGGVEFAHKSFGEFLCAERLQESLEDWTRPGTKRYQEFNTPNDLMNWEIYDLLGGFPLTPEIMEYLMALLADSQEFRPVQLFQRLENFYFAWCKGDFINLTTETLPQIKARQIDAHLSSQGTAWGQRDVDILAGLNVLILLLELHRYAQTRDELKDQIVFYPCGKPGTDNFDEDRLLQVIGYSCCISVLAFSNIVGSFLSGANLSGANLRRANLSGANLSSANLSDANLSGANLNGINLSDADLSRANLRGADLSDADLSSAYLIDVNLRSADLSGTDLSDADLSGTDLSRANLNGINLNGVNLSGANLNGINLSGVNLSGANLNGVNLSGADLSGADLSRTDLNGVKLSDAYLSDADLSDTDLSGVDLSRVNLSGANLSRVDLSGADLSRTDLSGADLRGVDLSGANLSDTDLSGANLSDTDLSGVDLSGANLSDTDLSGANLSGANLSNTDLSGANLSDTDLSGANLSGANLSGADLSGADLSGADLKGVNLSDADLSNADLSNADLSGVNLSDANLSDANLSDANLSDADLSNADLSGADLKGVNLSCANLSDANLSDADLSDADLENATWNEYTNFQSLRGWETSVNMPEELKKLLSS